MIARRMGEWGGGTVDSGHAWSGRLTRNRRPWRVAVGAPIKLSSPIHAPINRNGRRACSSTRSGLTQEPFQEAPVADAIVCPETSAVTHFVELADAEGRLILLPAATVRALRAIGQSSITVTVSLTSDPAQPWLTVTEAARLHMTDVDGMTLEVAKAKVSRACRTDRFACEGEGSRRRIEPRTFDAWRLSERERNLDAADDAE